MNPDKLRELMDEQGELVEQLSNLPMRDLQAMSADVNLSYAAVCRMLDISPSLKEMIFKQSFINYVLNYIVDEE